MKKILLFLILSVLPLSLSASELTIHKTLTGYSFSSDEIDVEVPYYMMSKQIRSTSPSKLAAILNSGNAYLDFKECSDGSYAVDLQGRIRGGGPLTGAFLYWATKVTCYSTAAAAAGTIVVSGAGAAGGALAGGVSYVAGGALASTAAGGAATCAGLAPASSIIGGAIVGAGAEGAAVMGTVGVVTSAGGVAGAIAAVESASLGAFAIGCSIPFLP